MRYLEAKYGEMSGVGSGVKQEGFVLRNVIARLRLSYAAPADWSGPTRSVEVQLPLTTTMGNLSVLLLRLFRVAPEQ